MDSKTIKKDVDLMIEAMRLQDVVRYRFDPYWVAENNLQDKIEKITLNVSNPTPTIAGIFRIW